MRIDAVVLFAALTTFSLGLFIAGIFVGKPFVAAIGAVMFWAFLTLLVHLSTGSESADPRNTTTEDRA